ncbi:DUF3021 family protein [Ornithinibacillus sp. BX22]|uniref:DUF3021 family protein n=1 Tax=Ornithinibacillus hominis TaxID=2763055 RepID=A0A923L580_9BACI|nr:DUF3021 family protein [Ornithinibacillus hominis]MBC5636723.1 DUF3021 family protein [Ornithinibacillus hominis]
MNLLLKGLIRGVIPFVLLLIISLWNRLQGSVEESNAFFFYGVVVFFLGLTSVIYEINHWKFSKQILAHYGAMLITVFPTLLLSGFYSLNSFVDLVKVYLEFNITGIVLFFSTYLIFKLIRKLNHVKAE